MSLLMFSILQLKFTGEELNGTKSSLASLELPVTVTLETFCIWKKSPYVSMLLMARACEHYSVVTEYFQVRGNFFCQKEGRITSI